MRQVIYVQRIVFSPIKQNNIRFFNTLPWRCEVAEPKPFVNSAQHFCETTVKPDYTALRS